MMQDEDKFEEEFSNWAKTVLCLKNTRDSSIGFIEHKMKPFVDELVQMHGANEKSHFHELLIKVAVNGEVKKTRSKANKSKKTWTLYDNRCRTCVNVFQKILDNFPDSYSCERWARHASKQTMNRSNYWWIISKLYTSPNDVVEAAMEPKSVDPLAVFSLISRCKLFHENLIWFDVCQVIQCRHEIMHSVDNRLSEDKKDRYCSEMKTLIKKVTVDNSITEVLHSFDKVENTTVALFTEDGEIHQLADEALKLQEECLNADFKLPQGVHATMKSLAMSTKRQELELKLNQLEKQELERKYEEAEKKANQYKIDALELKLQHETEKNKGYEDNITKLESKVENKFENFQHERSKQDNEMSSFKSTIDALELKLQHETEKNKGYEDNLTKLESKIMNELKNLKQEKIKQDGEISSFKNKVENKFENFQHERSKQDNEMSSFKSTIDALELKLQHETEKNKGYEDDLTTIKNKVESKFDEFQNERSKQDNEMSSFKSAIENKLKDLKQEKSKQDSEVCSLKHTLPSYIYEVKSFNDIKVRILSDGLNECNITDMCQMPDGTVMLIDKSSMKLKRLDDKFNVTDFYQFVEIPVSVVSVSSTEVAVLDESRKLHFIETTLKLTLERTVAYKSIGCMIFVNDQFWIQSREGVYIYSSSGKVVKCLQIHSPSQGIPLACSICTNRDKTRAYVISRCSVYVLNTCGEELFTFPIKHEFSSITCTPDDVILISSNTYKTVNMYDIKGILLGELISESQMLSSPQSLLYDEKKNCLIIGYIGKKIQVFKLQK